jgi:hypothetical protein
MAFQGCNTFLLKEDYQQNLFRHRFVFPKLATNESQLPVICFLFTFHATFTSSARLYRFTWRNRMYSDLTRFFHSAETFTLLDMMQSIYGSQHNSGNIYVQTAGTDCN